MHPFCCISTVTDPMLPSRSNDFNHCHVTDTITTTTTTTNNNNNNNNSNRRVIVASSTTASFREQQPVVDVMINDIVGNGISGILYKWVNYGKGWRPRWFVLQDGVVSYYKIHGPDKIIVNHETEKGCKVIGEESLRRISSNHFHISLSHLRRKPFGEIHLKV